MSRRRKRRVHNEEKLSLSGMGSDLAIMLGNKALNSLGWCFLCLWPLEVCPGGAFVVHMDECLALSFLQTHGILAVNRPAAGVVT